MVPRGQLTRDDWIALARKALIASGIDDVKVDVLARRLKMTRGSFYWHFENRQALLDALIEDWEANNRREIAIMEARAADGQAGLSEIFQVWLGEDPSFPAFDLAVRGWARKSKSVARIVSAIDDAWVTLFQSFFEQSGMSAPESFVRARIFYLHQIGYYALGIEETLEQRIELMPYYHAALIGSPAPEGLEQVLRNAVLPKSREAGASAGKRTASVSVKDRDQGSKVSASQSKEPGSA